MRKFALFLFILIGCTSIPPGQIKNVKGFAKAARSFSTSPGYLYRSVSDFRQKLRLIESATLFTSDKIIPSLNHSLELKQSFDENALKVTTACDLIGIYADCLLSLTDVGYYRSLAEDSSDLIFDLHVNIAKYNNSFQNKIPASLGDFLGYTVFKLGSAKLSRMQKKYLKEFVDSGSVIINDVCSYFNDVLIASMDNEMTSLDNQFDNVMLHFYDNIEVYQRKQNVNPFDYLKYYNPVYIELKETLIQLHAVQKETVAGMKKIQSAHDELKTSLNNPLSAKELLLNIQDFYTTALELRRLRTN